MNASATTSEDLSTLTRLLGQGVASPREIHGGRNSRVLRFLAGGKSLIAKFYYRGAGDTRDRFAAETAALGFLNKSGSRFAPRLIACDAPAGCAVLEDLGSRKLSGPEVTQDHAEQAVDFAAELRGLRGKPGAESFAPASEAHFRLAGTEAHLRERVEALRSVKDSALAAYLFGELTPALEKALSWSRARVDFERELKTSDRTLSQSDFGFHNALLCGKAVRFVDYEYFGWDDPAKMICDFLLQPVDGLTRQARDRFKEAAVRRFAQKGLAERVEASYPLFGLKWALIILNGFLPQHAGRRDFAKAQEKPADQIEKSRKMLTRVLKEHEGFQ